MEDNKFVLEVSDLHTTFKTDNGDVSAVNGVSFKLEPGKTLGIVGESGAYSRLSASTSTANLRCCMSSLRSCRTCSLPADVRLY